MTPPKTIYVPDAAVATWDEAEQLWGNSLASLVNKLVGDYVGQRRAELARAREGVERIVVPMGQDGRFKHAFQGRWLLHPDHSDTRTGAEGDAGTYYGVALTEKGNIAVYTAHRDEGRKPSLEVYPSLEAAAAAGLPEDIVAMASGGDFVVELDI